MGIIVLAACDGSGVQFIVYIPADYGTGPNADPEVQLPDEVRLFIGVGDEHADRLSPEGFGNFQKRSGTYWLRDPSNIDPEVDRAPISIDSPAVFSYVRSNAVDEFGAVVAVGYTDGVPTSSATMFHAGFGEGVVLQYSMGLNGAADPRNPRMRSRVNQLEIWGADECVYVDNRRSDVEDDQHRVAFIVGSVEDRDCDGLVLGSGPPECNPDVHLGDGPAAAPSCLYSTDATSSDCMIGAVRCQDGLGDDMTCSPAGFCGAPELCSNCRDDNMMAEWDCAQRYSAFAMNTVGSFGLECQIPAVRGSTRIDLCEDEIHVAIVPPAGTTCDDVSVKASADPAFSDTFTLENFANMANVKVTNQGCALTVKPSGILGPLVPLDYSALMLVKLDGERGLAAPVHVVVVPDTGTVGCSSGSCTWVYQPGANSPDACVLGG